MLERRNGTVLEGSGVRWGLLAARMVLGERGVCRWVLYGLSSARSAVKPSPHSVHSSTLWLSGGGHAVRAKAGPGAAAAGGYDTLMSGRPPPAWPLLGRILSSCIEYTQAGEIAPSRGLAHLLWRGFRRELALSLARTPGLAPPYRPSGPGSAQPLRSRAPLVHSFSYTGRGAAVPSDL